MYIDSHCHLISEKMDEIGGANAVIERAHDAGVSGMLSVCTHIGKETEQLIKLADNYENIWISIGTHPHDAIDEQAISLSELVRIANSHQKIVAIGESGLDYYYDNSPRDVQIESFRKHVLASVESGLPIIIHSRDADADTIKTLTENGNPDGVMHCFSGSPWLASAALEAGLYVSFSGILTFKNAQGLRDIAKTVPLDRILIETDAPYLAPQPHRGKVCEPAFVINTAKCLAEIKNMPIEEIAEITTNNFHKLFNKTI